MADNRYTIQVGKKEKNEKKRPLQKDELYKVKDTPDSSKIQKDSKEEYFNEAVWGNDLQIDEKIDEEVLLEKRRYVRARFIQHIECTQVGDDINKELTALGGPLDIMIFDISMGGLGTVSYSEIKKGTVLAFGLTLDQIEYPVKAEVAYCVPADDKFRLGLRILPEDKTFIKHLKIVVARITLAARLNDGPDDV